MPIQTRSANAGDLQVTLRCDGQVVEAQFASSPEDAADTAIIMIKHVGELDDGDSITVTNADPGDGVTLVPDDDTHG
jgi:hypothetical protein